MKILSMTATFGKLQNETLTLQPGLNVIEASNEWGKSTWCAFIIAMLYGIDTRERSTAASLADKEHYKPWSGAPMAGTMRIDWNGRDITLQRSSEGRIPMGKFHAYETQTGIAVPELTAENCGQQLLGVERSVFTRSAFLRFSDLPVKQDESLRSRLNALVTTGDDSGAAQSLEKKLKDLKNRIRFNRTGSLPQAQALQSQLQNDLQQQEQSLLQIGSVQRRRQELQQRLDELENHKLALRHAAAENDRVRIENARQEAQNAHARYNALEQQCAALPSRRQAEENLNQLSSLRRDWDSLQMEEQMLPLSPHIPPTPAAFTGMTPEDAVATARSDRAAAEALELKKSPLGTILMILGAVVLMASIGLVLAVKPILIGIIALFVGAILAVGGGVLFAGQNKRLQAARTQLDTLTTRYGSSDPKQWEQAAEAFNQSFIAYRQELAAYTALRGNLDQRREILTQRLRSVEGSGSLTDRMEHWQQIIARWDELDDLRRSCQQYDSHLQALAAMAKESIPAPGPDALTYTEAETSRLISDVTFELSQLQRKLGQYQGQAQAIGSREALEAQLAQVTARIDRLEMTYNALELALQTLQQAKTQLQRRFAPRITQQARELFARLTGGRYDRLTLGSDLQMDVAATDETVSHGALWRSDGTADQLYLALRLAVARELMPASPLVLDDALIRFDDKRLMTALSILSEEAETKQVLLFTCQTRENQLLRDL